MLCCRPPQESAAQDLLPLLLRAKHQICILSAGLIKKVYGIISFQRLATVAVSCVIMFNQPAQNFVTGSLPFQICIMLGTLLGECQRCGLCCLGCRSWQLVLS